jgi:tetratricopeptide (TPR) repeat protein
MHRRVLLFLLGGLLWTEISAGKIQLDEVPETAPRPDRKKEKQLLTPEEHKKAMDDVVQNLYNQGLKAVNEKKWREAREAFEHVLILRPRHAPAKRQLAYVKKKLEPPPLSREKKAAKVKKDSDARLVRDLSIKLAEGVSAKDWEDVERVANNLLALRPGDAEARRQLRNARREMSQKALLLAEERERNGDLAGAIEAYREALSKEEDPAILAKIDVLRDQLNASNRKKSEELYLEALAAAQAGKEEEARVLCRRALRLDPENLQAERMKERLDLRLQK